MQQHKVLAETGAIWTEPTIGLVTPFSRGLYAPFSGSTIGSFSLYMLSALETSTRE